MKRFYVTILFLSVVLLVPSANACYDCSLTIDYQGIFQDNCVQEFGSRATSCTERTRRVECPNANYVGPCYETTCHLLGVCDLFQGRMQPFGWPLVAGQVIAEVRRARTGVGGW